MRRFSSRALLAAASAALAAVLLIAGGLALWGSAYVHNTVQGQLASQQIFFPPASAFAHAKSGTEITPGMIRSVSQYAGQQMLTGQQAEAYADHFIAVHIQNMAAGKTYSQLSAESIAQPDNAQLAATVGTVFKGETLRSMLLNAYGWWKVSQIVYIVSLALFGLGALAGLAAAYLLTFGRRRAAPSRSRSRVATRASPRPRPRKQPAAKPQPAPQEATDTERPPARAARRHRGSFRAEQTMPCESPMSECRQLTRWSSSSPPRKRSSPSDAQERGSCRSFSHLSPRLALNSFAAPGPSA